MLGCGVVMAAILLCMGAVTLAIDGACYSSLTQRLPIYPSATVVSERHNFIRAFGMGETVMVLYTSDPPDEVTSWYARTIGQVIRESLQRGGPLRFGATDWSVGRAEDGVGSQIILFGTCVQ